MRKYYLLTLLLLPVLLLNCDGKPARIDTEEQEELQQTSATVSVIDAEELLRRVNTSEAPVRVVNFWATWCKPCIAELPYFEQARQHFAKDNVEFTYASLDFADEVESKVHPFLKKCPLGGNVVVLAEPDLDAMINRIDSSWSGAIPATMIVSNNGQQVFHEGEYDSATLFTTIQKQLLK
jgi:thiol-disulfide isomerase/thioredoxin